MRTRHWLAALTSGCMALAGIGTAGAQQPPMPTNGNPDQVGLGMLPPPFNSTYGPALPGTASVNQPGYPPGANPWPGISPFAGPPYNQTIYENGFWWNRMKQGNRQYYGTVEAVFSHTHNPPSTLIGAPNVNPLSNDPTIRYGTSSTSGTSGTSTSSSSTSTSGTSGSTGTSGGGSFLSTTFNGTLTTFTTQTTYFNQAPSGPGPVISASGTSTGTSSTAGTTAGSTGTTSTTGATSGTSGASSGTGTSGINIFSNHDTGVLPSDLNAAGIRGSWGWFNNDDTGFVMSGFSVSQASSVWSLADPLLNLNSNSPNFDPFHLHAWFGLPLAGADTDGTNNGAIADGAVIPYDMRVQVSFVSRLAGGNVDWYFEPIYDQGLIKIRPTAGAKYVRLQQGFQFDGYDSGTGYTVSTGSSSTSGSTSGTSGTSSTSGTSGSSGSTSAGYLSPSSFQTNFTLPNIIHSQLSSSTLSDMGGPEAGFRIDLGGKKFQLWTQTKAGALANVSQRQVNGFNIGNAFNITSGNTLTAMPNDPKLTGFNHDYTTTTMSPMFEQQINCKLPIFNLVPYLNKLEFFERAYLTGGYTFLWIGDVYQPNNDIVWNQTVVNTTTTTNSAGVSNTTSVVGQSPQLNSHKSDFFNSMFNVGIEWNY